MIKGVIHTPTLEDYIEVIKYAIDGGILWNDRRDKTIHEEYWSHHGSETCVNIDMHIRYASRRFYTGNHDHIITIVEFLKEAEKDNIEQLLKDFK